VSGSTEKFIKAILTEISKKGRWKMKWLNDHRMRIGLVGFLAAIVISAGNVKADFVWTQKADMPTPRWSHTSAVVNGKIYVIGGAPSEPDESVLSVVEEYDPATDTWTRKADMPTARGWISPSSAVVDGKIYIIGGWDGRRTTGSSPIVEEYDPAADTWTRKANMPTGRDSTATVALDGKIYAIGGAVGGYLGRKIVEQYDPVTDTWTRKADMPVYLWGLCANVVNGKIYTVGGRKTTSAETFVQEYDPATDTWTSKADMPVATSQMASVVLDNKIVVIGGWRLSMDSPYKIVQIYDTKNDIWTREAYPPFWKAAFSAEVVRGRIFAFGGTDRPHPCPATSTVYECDTSYIPKFFDLNGDGIVDSADICFMVDYWGTDEWLCDVAPLPFGDGIVDVEDLKVLAGHLFDDYRALAQWRLDGKEGDIAYDSVGGHDGILYGEPIWQPTEGQVCGALELDGIDDYVETDFVLDPADGAFSVFAWIQGGAPGQVIISQIDGDGAGERWLGTDAISGNLMTGLVPKKIGWVTPRPLVSESVITDIQWHHVGFVWDGSYRALYVDGIEVTKDTAVQNPLKSADGGLYIGVGKDYAAGTFFSGLIDDVRIYNQALTTEEIAALAQ
jgi:N-acetylneuraminic acid mutarotase